MFGKILIANRGEIAVRVARTCRELGVRTVAVHSTADRGSAVTRIADEVVQIGPAPARSSYLCQAAVLQAALSTGAEAIHPGYGFLSEDPDFAEACESTGLVFIGPPAAVMARLGGKVSAREVMGRAGLPMLPGGRTPHDAPDAERIATEIGYPVIVKASAGGGGRGMCVVHRPATLAEDYLRTRATARLLFGDDRVYIEKYLVAARHVEVQVVCDNQGNAVHLGTRDCSVQRRHQKLVEEAPAPLLPDGLAERIGEAAVRGALAAGYVGVGTFEFLLGPDGGFYFMEVNCRIQVEHPVTEAITGLDLVREQLRVASGEPLGLSQDQVRLAGVSIECRINAEDPEHEFRPAPGTVERFRPAGGPFVRVDTHAFEGYAVPPFYDSLLAKLIVWGPDREVALARAERALAEFEVSGPGVRTTIGFLQRVLADDRFRKAGHDTGLVERLLAGDAEGARDAEGASDAGYAGDAAPRP